MARGLRFCAIAAMAAGAAFALEFAGIGPGTEPPAVFSESGAVLSCERFSDGFLLTLGSNCDDIILSVPGLDVANAGFRVLSGENTIVMEGKGLFLPLSECHEAASVYVYALDGSPLDAVDGVSASRQSTGAGKSILSSARRATALRSTASSHEDDGFPGLFGSFTVTVSLHKPDPLDITLLGLSSPGGVLSMGTIPEFSIGGPSYSNVCSVSATGGVFIPGATGIYAFQVAGDDDVSLTVGDVTATAHWPDRKLGRVAQGVFTAGIAYPVEFEALSIGGPASAEIVKFAEFTPASHPKLVVEPKNVQFSPKCPTNECAYAWMEGDGVPGATYSVAAIECSPGVASEGAAAWADAGAAEWGGANRTGVAVFGLYANGVLVATDSAVFTPLAEKEPECDCDCNEGTSAGGGCVAFSQRFGRTPWIANLPVGRLAIEETLPVARLWTRAALVYDHPMCRRFVARSGGAPLDLVVLDPFGRGTEYRDGRPAGMSSGLARGLRYDGDGLLVEVLEDRTEVTYNPDGTAKSIRPPDGEPVAVEDLGIDIFRSEQTFAITSIVSRADGRMDVETISTNSYRVTWRSVSGDMVKSFTFSGDGKTEFRLDEYRNEDFRFASEWEYDAVARDWIFTRAPGTDAATVRAKSIEFDATNKTWNAVWRTLDATGAVVRTETSVLDVAGRSIMETERTDCGKTIYRAVRGPSGPAVSKTDSRGYEKLYSYDGWNRVVSEISTVKGGIARRIEWTYPEELPDGGVVERRPCRRVVKENGIVVEDEETVFGDGIETRIRRAGEEERSRFREFDSRGRTTLSVDESGRAVRISYSPFDGTDFSWTETRDVGVWTETDGFSAIDGRSTRRTVSYNASGNAVEEREYALVEGAWRETAWTTNRFNATHKKVFSEKSNGKSSVAGWICTGPAWTLGEGGIATTNSFDGAKRKILSVRYGPHGAVATAYAYDANGRVVRETDAADGCETRTTLRSRDGRGRIVSETDPAGLTTEYAYSDDDLTTTETLPSGGTIVTIVNPDGTLASVTGTAVTPEYRSYGVTEGGLRWEKIAYLSPDGARWRKTYRNAFGETVREEHPGADGSTLATERVFDAKGRQVSEVSSGRPAKTRTYDLWGDVAAMTLSTDGQTRTVAIESSFAFRDGEVWRVESSEKSCSDPSVAPLKTEKATQVSGLSLSNESRSIATDVRGNKTETWTSFDPAVSARMSYERIPEASNIAAAESIDGIEVVRVSHSAVTNRVSCDAYRRIATETDGRGNATTYAYDAAGRLESIADATGATTSYAYDAAGRVASVANALGVATVYEYDLRGNKTYEGGGTYPASFAYDAFNVMTNMTTYREAGGTQFIASGAAGDATSWTYDEATGLLVAKTYANGKGPSYTYTPEGSLATRTWARGIVTTYSYDGWNNLTNTSYSDGTPSVSLMYDAMGRLTNATDAAGTTSFAYDASGLPVKEKTSGLYSKTLGRLYDVFGRSTGYNMDGGRMTIIEYEPATARVKRIKSGNSWIENRYLAGTDLRDRIKYGSGGYAYYDYEDSRDIVARVRNVFGGETLSQYDYETDAAGRRTGISRSGSMMSEARTDCYGYNDRNELVSGTKSTAATNLTEYAYQYDDIGNRLSSLDLGTNRTYVANALNQYTQISNLCDSASLREEFIPQFDDDGNQTLVQTSTGVWQVTYNGENRPVLWECGTTNVTMKYDRMGRRVLFRETVDGAVTDRNYSFVYDGYLCIQRLNATTKNVKLIFTWDPAEKTATRPLLVEKPKVAKMYVAHDGNKNVSELVFFSGGSGVAAHYEYAPFGAATASTRNSASTAYDFRTYNPFRFSSEYADDTLGLVYYNYRHYNPLDGRWCGKDIIFDGCNSYSFLANYVWWNDILGKKIYIAARNLYSKIVNLAINHMFIVLEIDNYDKLQQCCPDIYNNTVGSQDKIAEKYFIMGGFPEDNGSKMVVKYNEEKDREALEESLNNRPSDWKEVLKSTFTVDWDYQSKNVDIGSDCEEKVMCKLLTAAENYRKHPVDYHANGDNCVKWVKSIFHAIDINVEVDFSGFDFDWWTLIDKSHFIE